jgi:hypothetical protein
MKFAVAFAVGMAGLVFGASMGCAARHETAASVAADTAGVAIANLPVLASFDFTQGASGDDVVGGEHTGVAVDILGRGLLHITGRSVVNGSLKMRVTAGGTESNVEIAVANGDSSVQIAGAFSRAVTGDGLVAHVVYVHDAGRLGQRVLLTVVKPGNEARPAAERNPNELAVAWRAVEAVEGAQDAFPVLLERDPGSHLPPLSPAVAALLPDFKNFVSLGNSSLTPYEARELVLGLGAEGEGSWTSAHLRSGDRVAVEVSGTPTHGIILEAGDGDDSTPNGGGEWVNVLVVDAATGHLAQKIVTLDDPTVKVTALLASSLLDGRF